MPMLTAAKLLTTGIIAASAIPPILIAETTIDYSSPGLIIGALFMFIAACATMLYKVVLAPLFAVFVENLKSANDERSKFLAYTVEMNKTYADNAALNAQNNVEMKGVIADMTKQLRILTNTNTKQMALVRDVANGTTPTLPAEA